MILVLRVLRGIVDDQDIGLTRLLEEAEVRKEVWLMDSYNRRGFTPPVPLPLRSRREDGLQVQHLDHESLGILATALRASSPSQAAEAVLVEVRA